VRVGLVAARRARTAGETMPGTAPRERWLDAHFPDQAEAWRQALIAEGRDPADYVALPVHPWQARHVIPARFRRSLARGDLVLLNGPGIPCAPTVSLRTLVPAAAAPAPHLKMSLGVRLTSVERTISPRSCEMGPRISRLLQDLIGRDAVLSAGLEILPEEAGLYFASSDPGELEQARHLAALLRRNPALVCGDDEVVIPTTALTADSPLTGAPLFLDIAQAAGDSGTAAVRTRVAQYAEALMRPLLALYLRYGIGLEAHLQNTLTVYGRDGALRRFLFRDFAGIRIHEDSLRAAGLTLTVHPDRLTVVDDRRPARARLTAQALHRQIGFLIGRSCRHLGIGEGPFWSDVGEVVETIFDDLRGDVAAATWREDRAAFLDDDWELKANLRMRFDDLSRDVVVAGTNPLRRAAR
jgi:siderophore synthetase component